VRFALSDVYGQGGKGGEDLAAEVLQAFEKDEHRFQFLYPLEMPLLEKIETVARKIYGAAGVAMEGKIRRKIQRFEKDGFGGLPVCIAKTQYSLSDDAEHLGRPRDFTVIVTDASLSAGAGFVVALCGEIMTMPGLPKVPAAERIDVTDDGEITGITG
jgi:formate--tetrahydrofolate ligase